MSNYLFIYGSLITGTPHAQIDRCIQRDCIDLGAAYVNGRLYDLGSYPGALPDPNRKVFGRLLKIRNANAVLHLLDAYEAYDPLQPRKSEFYRDTTLAILTESEEKFRCWIYWFNRKAYAARIIEEGDYVAYINAKEILRVNLRPLTRHL